MEFFDRFTASVSKTVKQASDSAKVLADKNRIRRDLAAMENELRNRYRDIGEKFFNEHKDNPDPEYQDLFAALTELQVQLAAKQRELESLDGLITCPECGRGIPKDAKFCSFCGATAPVIEAPVPEAPMQNICPVCGAALAPDAVFCAACGNRLPEIPAAQSAAPQGVCPNCGEKLAPDALFCPTCGTKAPGID